MLYYIQYIFYGLPIIALLFFIISLCRYISAKRKNKAMPNSYSTEEIKKRKLLLIVSSVIAGVFIMVVVSLIVLLFMAAAYM
ncbi:MAG: hypothetical protein IJZ34_12660 [Lachnospiraceae bacterium]|nr:hypothetical protein [Lachnospiraceae bacterium]